MEGWGWAGVGGAEKRLEALSCEVCRGVAKNCSLLRCPFYRGLVKDVLRSLKRGNILSGPTPPTVLVGEWGYPRVYVGTGLVIAEGLDLRLLESPSSWLNVPLDDLLNMRLSILLGRTRVNVRPARASQKIIEAVQESSASQRPMDVELKLSNSNIKFIPGFGVRHAPHGPTGAVEYIRLTENPSIPRTVSRVINDPHIPTVEAVQKLTAGGVDEYYLVRLLSAGLLGRGIDRRFVPTEWSITAVDDMLGRMAFKRVRGYKVIDDFRVYAFSAHYNSAYVILTPTVWMYELLEGWVKSMQIYSDYELYWGRKSYADNTGGAYYACRLPILAHLDKERRQAGAIVIFEVDAGWIPLGVWRFREIVRAALRGRPVRCSGLAEALELVEGRLRIGLAEYMSRSRLIPALLRQTKLV